MTNHGILQKKAPKNHRAGEQDEASVRAGRGRPPSPSWLRVCFCVVFRNLHRTEVHKKSAACLSPTSSVTSLHWIRVPLKCMDEVNESCSPQKRKTKRVRCSGQTGTMVFCRCCIWDSTSCCTLAMMMSWWDGVMMPSRSSSLRGAHTQGRGQKQMNK